MLQPGTVIRTVKQVGTTKAGTEMTVVRPDPQSPGEGDVVAIHEGMSYPIFLFAEEFEVVRAT